MAAHILVVFPGCRHFVALVDVYVAMILIIPNAIRTAELLLRNIAESNAVIPSLSYTLLPTIEGVQHSRFG